MYHCPKNEEIITKTHTTSVIKSYTSQWFIYTSDVHESNEWKNSQINETTEQILFNHITFIGFEKVTFRWNFHFEKLENPVLIQRTLK